MAAYPQIPRAVISKKGGGWTAARGPLGGGSEYLNYCIIKLEGGGL